VTLSTQTHMHHMVEKETKNR